MRKFLLMLVLAVAAHGAEVELWWVSPTGSMKPLFDESYLLYVEKVPFYEIKVGDIIIYRTKFPIFFDGSYYDAIVHQVWNRSSGGSILLCKGTANNKPDPELITESMYVGKVVKWITKEDFFKQ